MIAKVIELDDSHDAGLRALLVAEGCLHDALSLIDIRYRPYEKLYVALADADVVGFLEGTFVDVSEPGGGFPAPRARIMKLIVSTRFRRRGIATALVRRFVADARAERLDSLVLYPDPQEAGYEGRMGFFACCGVQKTDSPGLLGARLASVLPD
ncbi:GNAT family N-acetyltransferase [Streptomyces phaeofaciens]|jgi:GNAT superfamily N-acetyltransferase|uniref:GNAT family N-acetyltransferase n=1 Tax=Streptomyces phaeofaciens TaxID=68254 RepID=UPI0036B6B65C